MAVVLQHHQFYSIEPSPSWLCLRLSCKTNKFKNIFALFPPNDFDLFKCQQVLLHLHAPLQCRTLIYHSICFSLLPTLLLYYLLYFSATYTITLLSTLLLNYRLYYFTTYSITDSISLPCTLLLSYLLYYSTTNSITMLPTQFLCHLLYNSTTDSITLLLPNTNTLLITRILYLYLITVGTVYKG